MTTRHQRILIGATVPETVRFFVTGQAQFLAEHGFDVHVACSDNSEFTEFESARLHYHQISMARGPSFRNDLAALVDWVRLIRRIKPDVVMSGTPKAGLLATIAARVSRTPRIIYLLRGLRMEGLTGNPRRLSMFMEWLSCRAATEVICVSKSLAQRVVALGIASADRTSVLGKGASNGINVDFFRPPTLTEREAARRKWGIPTDAVAYGFAGRMTSDKGIPQLAAAFGRLAPDSANTWLLVAGELDAVRPLGPTTLAELNLPRCLLLGQISDIRSFYWALDAFCLPSLREGMPNVNLEAAATGLPVITTDATGCRDSIIDGTTGCMSIAGDATSLYEAFMQLSDSTTRSAYGLAGREWVSQHFRNEIVWGNLLAFLRSSA
jgi:glycosyltransferase involved in cell wall biosynthesis